MASEIIATIEGAQIKLAQAQAVIASMRASGSTTGSVDGALGDVEAMLDQVQDDLASAAIDLDV